MEYSANRFRIFFLCAGAIAFRANAQDISGKVLDKRFWPISGAKVCSSNSTSSCVLTASDGSFHLSGSTYVHSSPYQALPHRALRLPMEKAPSRFAADGRQLLADHFGGLLAFNMRTGGDSRGTVGAKPAALAATSLTSTKAGYATTNYVPLSDTAHGIAIVMGGAGENVATLFDGASLSNWIQVPAASWAIKDGAIASAGVGRGEMYTAKDYLDYRIIFSVRQISGNHSPCVLYFCQRPPAGQNGLDALGAVQWQAPTMGTWDYRPGKNNDGSAYYTHLIDPRLNRNQWSQCEMIVHGRTGTAHMGCCQENSAAPCKGVEMLRFQDASAGRGGPFALQMHNAGLYDEYKNISIETDPKNDSLFIAK